MNRLQNIWFCRNLRWNKL